MLKIKILKFAAGVVLFFFIGILLGTFSRSYVYPENKYYPKANILDAEINLSPVHKSASNETDSRLDKESETSHPIDGVVQEEKAENIDCNFVMPKKPVFDAKPIKNILTISAEPSKPMKLALFFENTGNVPWFSVKNKCPTGVRVNLGTVRDMDRASDFFTSEDRGGEGWTSNNRIEMQTDRVEPGQIGVFEFTSLAPETTDIYREFFALVAENKTWMKKSEMMIDFYVGETGETEENIGKKSLYAIDSMKFSEFDLNAEKLIEIDLSEQKMYVYVGDKLIRIFRISTGAPDTPTPTGSFKIEFKQKVRIAGGGIPYIMPKWQTVYRGVGLHALPSFGNAKLRKKIRELPPDEDAPVEWFKNDMLWTEAVNHIGKPVSHGCIRLLPEEANFLYEFTDVGTKVDIHR